MSLRSSGGLRRNLHGFTLLEILVVLVLVALVAGLTVPASTRWLAAARERGWQGDLRAQLQGQPLRAFHEGRALQLDAKAVRALAPDMPPEVEIEVSSPLSYSAVGAARAAELRFKRPGAPTLIWRIVAVTGEVES